MTREEAIQILSDLQDGSGQTYEAIRIAIEALSADAVSREDTVTLNSPISIQSDMVAVVRCKDCRHRVHDEERGLYYCEMYYGQGDVSDENFCQWGERREP